MYQYPKEEKMNKVIERLQGITYTAQTNPATLTGDDIAFVTQSVIPLSVTSEIITLKKLCTS